MTIKVNRKQIPMFKKLIFSLLLFSFFISSYAQNDFDYENPKEYEIAGIQTKGIRYLDNSALIQVTGLSVGQKIMIPGDAVTDAIKKLWGQKMFSDVKIYSVKIEGNKIWLEISLKERPRLSEVKYYGIRNSDQEDLNDKLDLVKGRQITQNTLILSENIIKQYLLINPRYKNHSLSGFIVFNNHFLIVFI
ncbi:MAG: hypothetical protein L3J56_12925 [Bacteroidales bacterium]|nr:hypothetical protein [Bacteroidales bacterium]